VVRSFTDRLFGGVCGGLAAAFRLNAWIVRIIFAAAALATLGAAAIWYGALWIALPQSSLVSRRGGFGTTLVALLLGILIVGGWAADRAGLLPMPTGQSIYVPALVTLFGLILVIRQVRA
jgi:phage shock protein PspC (stress-responsive transcriptional regulator)